MITLQDLAQDLEDKLNDALDAAIEGGTFPATAERYVFRITGDTADYQAPTREGNRVTVYIQGILSQTGSNVENTNQDTLNASVTARMELLVPVIETLNDDESKQLVDGVRAVLYTVLASNQIFELGGITVGAQYSLAVSGERRQSLQIGDSFIFSAYMTYFFVQGGVNSRSIKVTVNGNPVYYTRIGMSRSNQMEPNLPANTSDMAAQNVVSSNAFSINFDGPMVAGGFGNYLLSFLIGWEGDSFRKNGYPVEIDLGGGFKRIFHMVFETVQLNGETILNASYSVTMRDVMRLDNP